MTVWAEREAMVRGRPWDAPELLRIRQVWAGVFHAIDEDQARRKAEAVFGPCTIRRVVRLHDEGAHADDPPQLRR